MKAFLILVVSVFGVYLLFFSGGGHELEESAYGGSKTFTHSSHGYTMQLPEKYYEVRDGSRLRTSNLKLSTYFHAAGDPKTVFIVGEIQGRFGEHMIDKLNRLKKGEISEKIFLEKVANPNSASKVISVDGAKVFISTTSRPSNLSTMVFFESDNRMVGFMIAHSAGRTKEVYKIVRTIQII